MLPSFTLSSMPDLSLPAILKAGLQASRPWMFLAAFLAYLVLVSRLRHRRRKWMESRFNYPDRASFAKMTVDDAWAIQTYLVELEFPKVFSTSVFFALFKTYGIPSISSLLLETGQLANGRTTSKRSADTGVILTNVVLNKPTSRRAYDGIARMNYLHHGYRKAGKILDDDMLYTLSLFALEATRWTSKYEWRTLTDMERCAIGTYWKDLGDDMEIPYDALESSKTGWQNGLQWLDELEDWSLRYEEAHMVPAESNRILAAGTLDLLLFNLPDSFKELGRKFVAALVEPRLRSAMMFDEPPPIYFKILHNVITIRKFYLRYLALPRPYFRRARYINSHPDPETGRFHSIRYRAHPWYVKPSFKTRWGLKAWRIWLAGGALPGDEGGKYIPEGYDLSEVGPEYKKGKGRKQMEETREKLRERRRGGCPFVLEN